MPLIFMNQRRGTRIAQDPFYASTALDLRFNGNFVDSANSFSCTPIGSYTFDTVNRHEGNASLYLANSGYVEMTAVSPFTIGTGNFTIEGWFKPATNCPSSYAVSNATSFQSGSWLLEPTHSKAPGKWNFWAYEISSSVPVLVGTSNSLTNTWTHVAVVRYSDTLSLFINGIMESSRSLSPILNISPAWADQVLYAGTGSTGKFYGNIDRLRITKEARYITNFIPQ